MWSIALMFDKLKRKSLKRQTDKNLENRDLSQRNGPLKTIGYLVDEVIFQDFERLYEFSEELGLLRKNTTVYTFIELKKKAPSLIQNQINNRHFTWKGNINNQNANEFLDDPFDVLVGIYTSKNEFLDVMMSLSKAKFKVGFAGADERLFDLLIDIDLQDFDKFKSEFIKYLRILNKI